MNEEHIKAFVVLGTQKFQMDRLLKEIDRIVEKLPNFEFFAQIGYSTYKPKHYRYLEFMAKEDFYQTIQASDLLITHGGVGTITNGLKMGKPVITIPRRAEYHEHVDNHQTEIVEAFSKKGYVIMCSDESELEEKIRSFQRIQLTPFLSNRENVVKYLRKSLE